MAQVGVIPQVGVQPALVESAQGNGIGADLPVEGAEAHQVDGSLKHQHPGDGRVTGDGKGDAFVAAQHIPLEADAVLVVGAPLAGEPGLAGVVPSDEHAVVVLLILVEQTGVEEGPNHLGCDASLMQVGEHPAVVPVGWGQGELRLFLLGGRSGTAGAGGVPCPPVEVQQVLYCRPEFFSFEHLEKGNRVSARAVGIPLPGAAVFDHQAVHLPGGVVVTDPFQVIPQVLQQIRQVRILGGLHLLIREFPEVLPVCFLSRDHHPLRLKRKTARESVPQLGAFSQAVQQFCFRCFDGRQNPLRACFFLEADR